MDNIKIIILAAGQGKRMHCELPKVLHKVAGKTLLGHVIDSAKRGGSEKIAVIVGVEGNQVKDSLSEDIKVFWQNPPRGTGDAVMKAESFYNDNDTVIVLNGDSPLTKPETLKELIKSHIDQNNQVTVLSAKMNDPTDFGRIISDGDEFIKIVEEKDALPEEKKIKYVNAGIYCFNGKALKEALKEITPSNNQNEFYLTDTIEKIKEKNGRAGIYRIEDEKEIASVNSKIQLAEVAKIFRERINTDLMENGVTLIDPITTYIDKEVKIGSDTVIYPGCVIEGDTIIGKSCIIGPNSQIVDSVIHDNVEVKNSTVYESEIDSFTHVGPYAYLRPGSHIGKDVKIGDFVEVKNSKVGDNTKVSHLTYIGDAEVGKNTNIGCGTVFVNYDGKNKHQTIVEDNCFIGCNTNLVAPVKVKKGSYTAAGSTITQDVPENTLAVARARQENKIDYVDKMDLD